MNKAESVTICEPTEIVICKAKKTDHTKLVTFDDHMYKLQGELRSARKALYEYKISKPETSFPYELRQHVELTGHMDTLDGDMHKLEWKIHDTRETLLDMVHHWDEDESSEYSNGEDESSDTGVSSTDVTSSENESSGEDNRDCEPKEVTLHGFGKCKCGSSDESNTKDEDITMELS